MSMLTTVVRFFAPSFWLRQELGKFSPAISAEEIELILSGVSRYTNADSLRTLQSLVQLHQMLPEINARLARIGREPETLLGLVKQELSLYDLQCTKERYEMRALYASEGYDRDREVCDAYWSNLQERHSTLHRTRQERLLALGGTGYSPVILHITQKGGDGPAYTVQEEYTLLDVFATPEEALSFNPNDSLLPKPIRVVGAFVRTAEPAQAAA